MCITRKDMDSKINEIRQLKAMKEELEQNLSALQNEVIEYFKENEVDEVIGDNFKATYKMQSRETVSKEEVKKLLSAEDYQKVSKISTFPVLRIN